MRHKMFVQFKRKIGYHVHIYNEEQWLYLHVHAYYLETKSQTELLQLKIFGGNFKISISTIKRRQFRK